MWKLPSSACRPSIPGAGALPSACWRKAASTALMHSSGARRRSTSLRDRSSAPAAAPARARGALAGRAVFDASALFITPSWCLKPDLAASRRATRLFPSPRSPRPRSPPRRVVHASRAAARGRSTRFRRATCVAQRLSGHGAGREFERGPPVADAPLEDAGRGSPERLLIGDVQIAARKPDISEHVIVQIREARELAAMFDAYDESPPALRQHRGAVADPGGQANRREQLDKGVGSFRGIGL